MSCRKLQLTTVVLLAAVGHSLPALAESCGTDTAGQVRGIPLEADGQEKYNAGWSAYFDNDVLVPINRDEDYTGGFAFTYAGRRAQQWWVSLDRPLGGLDSLLGIERQGCGSRFTLHSLQVGVVAFTPGDIEIPTVIPGDRPYASLVYLANGRNYIRSKDDPAWHTSFSIGVIGLKLARAGQNAIHSALGIAEAEGWDHQISNGGEPTFRYTVARQALIASNFQRERTEFELKHSLAGSVGYLTEASAALSLRWGRINTPWWSFPPERVEYIAEPAPVIGGSDIRPGSRELYLWGGIKARARAYNAFLQGQFRDSDLEYSHSDLRPLIGEAWAGVTAQISREYRLSYVMRYQSSELKDGPGDREVIWGSLFLSRDL
ncbi:lipid A deacylase LpxR family protein [Solimonas sp. K1W22B-7]|uniref:lipid A deacylase LpxR family protein n=1 Tax=Solimonas sp. K1W22B-7 TaxID=2303331 RepID=UPI000E337BD2|nr:lipid A deacylase LpxR family protein [Solimonas sp. K1W22B-7]AXQ27515.1 lipid A deacylase LpxR family protein [Solimonas sp. K1W22B-7]